MYFAEIRPANIQKILAPQHLRLYFLCSGVKIPSFSSSIACGSPTAAEMREPQSEQQSAAWGVGELPTSHAMSKYNHVHHGIFADNHLFFHPIDIWHIFRSSRTANFRRNEQWKNRHILPTRHRGPHDSRHGRRARRTRGMLHLDAPDRRGLHAREARLGHSARRRAVHGRVGFHTPHTIRPTSATRRIRGIVAALGADRAEPARLRSRPIPDIPPLHEPFAAQDNGGNE